MRDRRFKFGAGTRAELCDCIRKSPSHFGISTMKATVIGAHGFIGRHLVMEFKRRGWACRPLDRVGREELGEGHLGHVVYCAGVTSDFLARPWDTVTAHVAGVREVVEYANYDSLLYLSSTRVYLRNRSTDKSSSIEVNSAERDELYNLTKLLGENVCRFSRSRARVVRLSNVYGPDWDGPTFLSEIIRMAVAGKISLKSNLQSAKDYVALSDVVAIIPSILLNGERDIYNIAYGANASHAAITGELQRLTGCDVVAAADGAEVSFPVIAVDRVRHEFGWRPRELLADLPELVRDYKRWLALRAPLTSS